MTNTEVLSGVLLHLYSSVHESHLSNLNFVTVVTTYSHFWPLNI